VSPAFLTGGTALLMDPVRLSKLIIDRITALGTVTYEELLARAKEKNIDQGIFDNAMSRVHKKKTVLVKDIKGELTYSIKPVEVKKTAFDILADWRKEHPYPEMNETNNGQHEIFAHLNFDYLFLTPDELVEYKEAMKGGRVYKRQRYQYVK